MYYIFEREVFAMKTVEVLLDSVDKVVSFVDKIKAYD